MKLAACNLLLSSSLAFAATVIDDFSSYGTRLNDGEAGPGNAYTWQVEHTIPGYNNELAISGGKLRLAGHGHPNTVQGIAELAFNNDFKPIVDGFTVTFDYHEYHDLLEVEVAIENNAVHTLSLADFTISYPATGTVTLIFGETGVTEQITGHADRVFTYTSLGIGGVSGDDLVESIKFIGNHRNNGQDIAEISNLSITAVPEPATAVLAISGLGILFFRRRR